MDQYAICGAPIDITIKLGYARLHRYDYPNITIVYDIEFIVNILHYAPLYSTLEAFYGSYETG